MEWTIDVVGAVLLTSLTGSILLLVWCGIGKWLDRRGHLNILYDFLRINSVFFCIPFVYLLFMWLDDSQNIFGGTLFLQTPVLLTLGIWLFWIWFVGAGGLLLVDMVSAILAGHRCKKGYACSLEELTCFEEVCRELNIRKPIPVLHSYHVDAPCLIGLFQSCVLLPQSDYTERELRVIFVHELTHYKQKDLWLKWLARLMTCIHWFNPIAWWYRRIVGRWSEYACDYYAYPKAESPKAYLEVLEEISQRVDQPFGVMAALLYEDETELLRRVKRVIYYQGIQKKSTGVAALICVFMCGVNALTVYGATEQMAEGYTRLYENTEVEWEQSNWMNGSYEEFTESEDDRGVLEELVVVPEDAKNSAMMLDWTVRKNTLKKIPTPNMKKDDIILVLAAVYPADAEVRVGIIEPDGTKRYVVGRDTISYAFRVEKAGAHFVYVENPGDASVEIAGVYQARKFSDLQLADGETAAEDVLVLGEGLFGQVLNSTDGESPLDQYASDHGWIEPGSRLTRQYGSQGIYNYHNQENFRCEFLIWVKNPDKNADSYFSMSAKVENFKLTIAVTTEQAVLERDMSDVLYVHLESIEPINQVSLWYDGELVNQQDLEHRVFLPGVGYWY